MAAARRLLATPPSPEAIAVFLRFVVVAIFLVMFVFYAIPRQKAFTVSAITESVKVHTVTDSTTEWSIYEGLELCRPRKEPLPESQEEPATGSREDALDESEDDAICNDRYYSHHTFDEEQTIRWSDDYVLDIQAYDAKRLLIYVTRLGDEEEEQQPVTIHGLEIEDGTLLYVRMDGTERPILPLRGYMTLGDPPLLSDANLLLQGRYEIRQSFAPRDGQYIVKSGDFVPGDRISFVRHPIPIWARPFTEDPDERDQGRVPARIFVSNLDTSSRGFNIVATTDLAYSDILLTRVGGQPTKIPVTAAQRLAADPFPVATATALGLLATLFGLINSFFGKSRASENRRER